jgi:hypothetical protein
MDELHFPIRRSFLFFLHKRLHYVADHFIPDLFYDVPRLLWILCPQLKKFLPLCMEQVLIRYYFDYESAQI